MQHHGLYKVRHMEYWSDASDNSDRFGQYLDDLDWLGFVELLQGNVMQALPRKTTGAFEDESPYNSLSRRLESNYRYPVRPWALPRPLWPWPRLRQPWQPS